MRTKSVDTYARELRAKIANKFGKYDDSLNEQVDATAMNRAMIAKLHTELMNGELTTIAVGSMGQHKTEVNPLLSAYDKAQRTYTMQLAALGLNKMAEKKADAPRTASDKDHPWTKFNEAIQ